MAFNGGPCPTTSTGIRPRGIAGISSICMPDRVNSPSRPKAPPGIGGAMRDTDILNDAAPPLSSFSSPEPSNLRQAHGTTMTMA
jgi:hypothetical protein